MPDTRPADDPVTALAALQTQFDDFKSTMLARASRNPTGTVAQSILDTAPPDTLFMQGQVVLRADYPVLWQWVQDNNRIQPGLFGAGDGTTTFGIPDWRNKMVYGAGPAVIAGTAVGANTITLATTQLPAHNHAASADTQGGHTHGFSTSGVGDHGHGTSGFTNTIGDHGGHVGQNYNAGPGGQFTVTADNPNNPRGGHNHTVIDPTFGAGGHSHSGGTDNQGPHSHNVTTSNTGGGGTIDNRPASVAINWLIWT